MATNYFVCTLGQAALLKKDDDLQLQTINSLLDRRNLEIPDLPAVGFCLPPPSDPSKPWTCRVLCFADVLLGSQVMSSVLCQTAIPPKQTVALLCPSSPEFLFAWLGLIRLGHPVLLLAPQCTPVAIAQLCRSCEAEVLLFDLQYEELAKSAGKVDFEETRTLQCQPLPVPRDGNIFDLVTGTAPKDLPIPNLDETDVAYLHHTSGTSTGVPKSIPQSHRAGVGVLPGLDGEQAATFTTTPLYHGGIADVFRAWTSKALIWLFPGKDVPITASNIIKCLEIAKSSEQDGHPSVKYFSSVPYVLQVMAGDPEGLKSLQEMDIVSVGGAALPVEVGDQLVADGVNLVSRFGSAECGFLMSSHRDYKHDREWQYLRPGHGVEALKFEPRDNDLSELVIMKGWPHMAKQNREDGSYATADLFQPHPSIANAWRYHSRADSQLTLITGKKFDPAPVEAAIATSPLLDDVFIFGNGKPYPGALLLRSPRARDMSNEALVQSVAAAVEKLNSESQGHAMIPRNMLIPMPHDEIALDKSSKGTILRGKAEERYRTKIEEAYFHVELDDDNNDNNKTEVPDSEVPRVIHELVKSITGKSGSLEQDTDLFSHGVDSVACMQIRHSLSQLIPKARQELPLTIVEDCGTIENLVHFVISKRNGPVWVAEKDQEKMMLELVDEYGTFDEHAGQAVLLTGATGGLGAHILNTYLTSNVSTVYCLVRAADHTAAEERVHEALEARKLTLLHGRGTAPRVVVLRAQLGLPYLGLGKDVYQQITAEVTIIQHVAWAVNFRIGLQSFVRDHIAGLHNMLDFALACQKTPRFIFCSSVASVMDWTVSDTVPECISEDPKTASPLGYSRSKWVAEQVCRNAHQQTKLNGRIAVMRVGQLSGDTRHGIWNMTEAYPLMLSTVQAIHCLPDLKGEYLTWLPLDVAAESFVQTAASMGDITLDSVGVFHIVNNDRSIQWKDLLQWLKKVQDFDIVQPDVWVGRLEEYGQQDNKHPALKLLGHWKSAFGSYEASAHQETDDGTERARYAMENTSKVAPVIRSVQSVDEEYFLKLWTWISGQGVDPGRTAYT